MLLRTRCAGESDSDEEDSSCVARRLCRCECLLYSVSQAMRRDDDCAMVALYSDCPLLRRC